MKTTTAPDMTTPAEKDAMALAVLAEVMMDMQDREWVPADAGEVHMWAGKLAHVSAYVTARIVSLDDRANRAEAELAAVRVRAEVRRNDDGSLDEIVGFGQFHLEQMHDGCWSANLGPHLVTLTAKGKIKAAVETDADAAREEK